MLGERARSGVPRCLKGSLGSRLDAQVFEAPWLRFAYHQVVMLAQHLTPAL